LHVVSLEQVGGARLFREALKLKSCQKIHLTQVLCELPHEVQFPPIDQKVFAITHVSDVMVENATPFQFTTYDRKDVNDEEMQYLDLVRCVSFPFSNKKTLLGREILEVGVFKDDRTGTGTLSVFGCQMRFDLRTHFPVRIPLFLTKIFFIQLLTTKAVFWRAVVEELLWFIKGSTDSLLLSNKKVHIWDGHSSRQYLDSIGKHERVVGDCGPIYGHQWRHSGAKYINKDTSYKGFDQLAWVIDRIKTNPNCRRIIMSAWNVS